MSGASVIWPPPITGIGGQLRPQHFQDAPRDETRMSGIERV